MAAWLIPALKAVLPHVGTIVSAAAPAFTRKSGGTDASQASLLQQQITELQAAASGNDAHIKKLAAQMQNTLEALELVASVTEARHRRTLALGIAAAVLSAASLGAVLYILLTR
jgi:hypothetical protein